MMTLDERQEHQEIWLLLPWLASGRLSPTERERAEQHVHRCLPCQNEFSLQQRMCSAFAEPDRVVYAPGPSFRKLMERIDSEAQTDRRGARAAVQPHLSPRGIAARLSHVSLWRPPGAAWAASFLALFALTGLLATAYRWSEPLYRTHTEVTAETPNVLHIALDRRLTIAEVEDLLRTQGARVVEGPGSTGIFGVSPSGLAPGTPAASVKQRLRDLARRLHADPRVVWVQPLAQDDTPTLSPGAGAPPER
ncbi:MAG TPA: hypothetical protein VFB37_13585 [Steroidobacteraceae bacterium]|nr:hypothetical protein [Steroidobacteraceae bacterium]